MVLGLDHYFLHRVRKLEGKDGNPLNEVRVICDSLTDNDGGPRRRQDDPDEG
jgi:hypothetical protein